MRLPVFVSVFKQNLVFFLSLLFLFLLPFWDGGTNFLAKIAILILPLPLFLLGLTRGEFRWENLPRGIVWFCLFFLLFAAASVIFSTSQIFSIPDFFQLLAFFLFFFLFLLTPKKNTREFTFGLVAVTALVLSFLSLVYLLPQVAKPTSGMNLVYATYGHSHLADYLVLAIPLVFALFLASPRGKVKILWGFFLVFLLLSLVLTFSRGAFLVLPPVILLLIFLFRPKPISEKLFGGFLVLIPLGILFLILLLSLSSLGLEAKLAEPQHWLVKQLVKPEFQAKRLDFWQQAVQGFLARPWFGFGWGTFELVALRFQKQTLGWSNFAHNFYLQVLAEAGIFALLSFLGFLFFSLRRLWRSVVQDKRNPFLVGGLGAILASSLHSFFDYDWHFPAIFLTFLLLIGTLVGKKSAGIATGATRGGRLKWGLVGLAFMVFLFGQTQLVGEYFYQKRDYQKALIFSPWPAVRVRQIGDKVSSEGQLQRILALSSQDPSMHYWVARRYYSLGQLEKATYHYQKAIEYNLWGNYHLYPQLIKLYNQLDKKKEKEQFYRFLAEQLKKNDTLPPEVALGKIFYFIGEDYLKEEKVEEVIFWWEKAAGAAPEWSYFHLELASFMIQKGDKEGAKKILENCARFRYPKVHCQNYLKKPISENALEPVGFWRGKISEIPD